MTVYKLTWSYQPDKNNFFNNRTNLNDAIKIFTLYFDTREKASQKEKDLKQAAQVMECYDLQVTVVEIEVL